ncbi:MAG TPA: TetR/AcrR family transcriptional regulator [Kofleriaceae bacterium]|nr:TetR/AcrR family transcriptional regulator [Kofleriaceae bacterium]
MKRKDEAKAREILAATISTVQELGIAGLSMEAVARRAGVATGTLYVYHPSKEALLDAAYLAVKSEVASEVFRDEALPVRPAFLKMAGAYLDYLVEHRAEVAFMEQVKHSTFLSDETRRTVEQSAKALYRLLERGKRELLLKPLDTALMIGFLQGTMRELSQVLGHMPAAGRAALRDQIAILCWDGLKL